ncbi:hypothetical protein WSM22_45150 [Cytophagales bacterium WSM2-2]|nr:hypothetical protein WSM22_45150 [Cytophagales bacterium WSM2-2]
MVRSVLFFITLCTVVSSALAQEKTRKAYRPDIPGFFTVDLGLNSGFNKPQNFNHGVWGSRTLNVYYNYPVRIAESKFTFNPGGGFSFERFKFTNNFALAQQPDGTYSLDNPTTTGVLPSTGVVVHRSMLVANYFDVMPLEFRFDTNPKDKARSFNVTVGARVGILFESHSKIEYSLNGVSTTLKNKQQNGLNQFRYGVYSRIGIGNFNWFAFYNLSPYFATNKGPVNSTVDPNRTTMNTMTIGISITGF